MEEVKTQGLILNSNNLNDNDKIFTILTRDLGKITAISKGIRSHKHKDFAAMQSFCYSEFVFSRKTGLYYVASANVLNNFFGIRNSVEQVSFATYELDIVKNLPEDTPPEEDYFNFILNSLYMISKAEEKCKDGDVVSYLKSLKAVFEMKTVCFEGFMPYIDVCAECRGAKELKYFDCMNGSVVCDNCIGNRKHNENFVEVYPFTLRLLNFLCKSDYKTVFSFNASGFSLDIISDIAERYLINCLEMYPPSLSYLKATVFGEKSV